MYLIVIICLLTTVLGIFDKNSSNEVDGNITAVKYSIFRLGVGVVISLVIALCLGENFEINATLMLSSLAFGVCVAVDLINYLFLAKTGMIALLTVSAQSSSLILPILFGMIFLKKPGNPIQWIFGLLVLVSAYMLCDSSKAIYSGFSFKTVIMVVIRFFASGFGTVSTQYFGNKGNGSINLFLALSYLVAATIIAAYLILCKGSFKEKTKPISKKLVFCGVGCAFFTCIPQAVIVLATSKVDPIIQFSVTAVLSVVFSMAVGAIFFKEKITLKSTLAVILASVSVILINYFNQGV